MHEHIFTAGFPGGLGLPEWVLIFLIVLLLFGGKKIPELMRSMGKGIKNFKEGMKGMEDEINQPGKPADYKDPERDKSSESKP